MVGIKHHTQTTKPNDPVYDVSANAWNEEHDPGAIADVLSNHDTTTHVLGTVVPHDGLASLTDVFISGLAEGHFLRYYGSYQQWRNVDLATLDVVVKSLRADLVGVGCTPDQNFPLKIEQDTDFPFGVRRTSTVTGKTCTFTLDNLAPYATTNDVSFIMRLYTSTGNLRYCGQFRAKWDVATDATRTSDFEIFGAKAGSYVTFLRLLGGRPIFPNPTVPAAAGSAGVAGEIA